MTTKPTPICGEHGVPKEWRETTFEYTEEGITVRVPGVYAWVCPESGEASFLAETTDELISTVRDLLEAAKRARERRSMPTEYRIFVRDPLLYESAA
jgi:YgiT-type zinc finger domain-containing protein